MASAGGGVTIEYTIRRHDQDAVLRTFSVSETDAVFPGDVVIVRADVTGPDIEFVSQ